VLEKRKTFDTGSCQPEFMWVADQHTSLDRPRRSEWSRGRAEEDQVHHTLHRQCLYTLIWLYSLVVTGIALLYSFLLIHSSSLPLIRLEILLPWLKITTRLAIWEKCRK
jgi:hypothetical protein